MSRACLEIPIKKETNIILVWVIVSILLFGILIPTFRIEARQYSQNTLTQESGWNDTFEDTIKISSYTNVTIEGGDVRLNDSFFDPLSWTKQGLAVDTGLFGEYDDTFAFDPTILKDDDGIYKMWYTGNDGTNHRILYANSTDGITWNKKTGVIINLGLSGSYDDTHAYSPTVIKEINGTYKMWYAGHDGSFARILWANSSDGLSWTKQGLVIDIGAMYCTNSVASPIVIKEGGLYKMWYSGYDGAKWRILYANSSDGMSWTEIGLVLDVGLPGEPDDQHVDSATVLKLLDGSYGMWYCGHPGVPATWKIYYANSTDGIAWNKQGLAIDTGLSGEYDDLHSYYPTVIKDSDGLDKMWYSGHDGAKIRILYATSPYAWITKGNLTSVKINLPNGYLWESLNISKTEPSAENNITVSILNGLSGVPIVGYTNMSGTDIDISGINPVSYPSIKLLANFSGNGSATPTLHEWWVNWTWDGNTPIINHTAVTQMNVNEVINITANVTDDVAVTGVTLCYKNIGDAFYTNVSMVLTAGNTVSGNWSADIPAQTTIGMAYYYINATDGALNSSHPYLNSYTNPHTIEIYDVTPPEISHTPLISVIANESVEVTAKVTDNIDVDDVRLFYYLDTTGGPTLAQNESMNDLGGGNYTYTVNVPVNALILHYNISANDTSNNWNETGEINVATTDPPPDIIDTTGGTPITDETFNITATISDNIGVVEAHLYYYFNTITGPTTPQNKTMYNPGGGNYNYTINIQVNGVTLYYNILANDTSDNWDETGEVVLSIEDDIRPTIIDLTSGTPTTRDIFTISVMVTDNIEVDEVDISYHFLTTTGLTSWQNITMNDIGGDNFNYGISIPSNALILYYSIATNDTSDNWNKTDVRSIEAADNDAPQIQDTTGTPSTGDEFTITATVTDNIAMDEVLLYYYFNTTTGLTTSQNVSMTFLGGGNYNHTLSVPASALTLYYNISANDTSNNWNETGLNSITVYDNDSPTADAGEYLTVDEATTVTLNAFGSTDNIGIVNYTWTFTHNGTVVTLYAVSPQFRFWTPGTYTVTLMVTDAAGNWNTDSMTVSVSQISGDGAGEYWWIILLILIIVIVTIVVAYLFKRKSSKPEEPQAARFDSPPTRESPDEPIPLRENDILGDIEKRYAEGHISKETYDMLRERYGDGSI